VSAAIDDLPTIPKTMWAALRAEGVVSGTRLLGVFLAAFVIGVVIELILRRAARPVGAQSGIGPGGQ